MAGERDVFAKAAMRLLPLMALLYVVNILDRVNVGFAALEMNKDLGIGPEGFGFISGVFFIGYFIFEIPSNVMLERVGARRWIFVILLIWSLVSMSTALAHDIRTLTVLRFTLGLAEGGFFPGMMLYLSYWFPQKNRARYTALFLAAIALANVVGAPLSGAILSMKPVAGVHNWQWLFVLEGAPAFLLAFAVLRWLPNGPKDARWLSAEERKIILAALAAEPPREHHDMLPMLKDRRIWLLIAPDYLIVLAQWGVWLWLPQIVHSLGYSVFGTTLVIAGLYAVSFVGSLLWAMSSDRTGERIWHIVIPCLVAAGGLIAAAIVRGNMESIVALEFAAVGLAACVTVFWVLPTRFLGGTAAAGGIALINSIANLGGFCGPYVVGWLKAHTGDYAAGMAAMAFCMILAAVMVLVLGRAMHLHAAGRAGATRTGA
ncbi:MAG: MFS transporter [Alphaproteobacteria bacterium]|nr:MFS transporter [Alphaproteobacteria bacterium]MDE1987605.1 MFS transporter [Alphaproteobacteria bacterium]MDE2162823.1 MFS transporter [Alphaproteobacteria bacterium]MDE2265197.1 MFS transporter [Alphaproteobacteria bacterium]